jgi:hypothetical protein
MLDSINISREELAEMLIKLSGHNKLVQLLPYGRVIQLICFDHPVDGPINISFK